MMICRRSRIVNIIMYKRDSYYIRRFIFFDDADVKTSVHRIVALIFKHALTLLLTVTDYIYDFSSIISSYIIFFFYF